MTKKIENIERGNIKFLREKEETVLIRMMKENDVNTLLHVVESKQNLEPLIYHRAKKEASFHIPRLQAYKVNKEELLQFLPDSKVLGRYGDCKKKHIIYKPDKLGQLIIENTINSLNELNEFETELLRHIYLYSLRIKQNSQGNYYICKVYDDKKVLIKELTIEKYLNNSLIMKEYDLTNDILQYKMTRSGKDKFREIIRPQIENKLDMTVKEWFEMPVLMREYIVRRKIKRKSAKKKESNIK